MNWCWLALRDTAPRDALACAAVTVTAADHMPGGFLAAWSSALPRPEGAAKVDSRAIDANGLSADVSLVLPPSGVTLAFDDIAVGHALRRALARPPLDVLTTMLLGDSRFAGALSAVRHRTSDLLDDDPFGRLFPARRLHVEAGLLGRMPAPAGPVIQRYGSDQPWPWDRFIDNPTQRCKDV